MIDKNKKYRTRCGYETHYSNIKGNGLFPLRFEVNLGTHWETHSYTSEGKHSVVQSSILDLIEVEEPKLQGYVNLYPTEGGQIYNTIDEAIKRKAITSLGTIDLSTLKPENFVK